jgi:LAO/AO transport system kinase
MIFLFLCVSMKADQLIQGITSGDFKALARALTLVENESEGYETLLKKLPAGQVPVIGFTGPPGAGKSTLINAVAGILVQQQKNVAVVAVDPTSPFNYGSLLADRVRMAERFTDPGVFIRSVATRGSLGGLSDKIIEITDVLKAAPFDILLVETVGVGQSEVEIAGLADVTVLVLVPEGGDDIQAMKSGIMEIADLFVVNKCDREGGERMASSLEKMAASRDGRPPRPVLQTSAVNRQGLDELARYISDPSNRQGSGDKQAFLFAEKLYRIIRKHRMKDVDKNQLAAKVKDRLAGGKLNLYAMAEEY